jgi:hydrogenase maturation protease
VIRVIGVGSPFGDDAAGLEAARRLAGAPPPGCEIVIADRPGVGLIELLDAAGAVVVIDAVQTGAPPGTLHDLELGRVGRVRPSPGSSHGLGVAEAVRLAAQLGRAPARGRFLGIEIGLPTDPSPDLTAPVRDGVARAVRRVRWWARRPGGIPVAARADDSDARVIATRTAMVGGPDPSPSRRAFGKDAGRSSADSPE